MILALALAIQIAPPSADTPFRQPQLAVKGDRYALVFGSGNDVYVASSTDKGAAFTKPVRIATGGKMALGRHRGPRVAWAGETIVISAPVGQKGGGADGDILSWRSTDGGRTWTGPVRINDQPAAAREGLHALAASPDGTLFAAWLDLREGKMALYGARSTDRGATWSHNVLIYRSPDGHICECCHPSVALGPGGTIYAMWRNWLGGSRDLYLATSTDNGATFRAQKLGEGTWPLNGCPMDGGGIALDTAGKPVTAWRREGTIYFDRSGAPEVALGRGKDPAIAAGNDGAWVVWTSPEGLMVSGPRVSSTPKVLAPSGEYPNLAGATTVVAAWESQGSIYVQRLSE